MLEQAIILLGVHLVKNFLFTRWYKQFNFRLLSQNKEWINTFYILIRNVAQQHSFNLAQETFWWSKNLQFIIVLYMVLIWSNDSINMSTFKMKNLHKYMLIMNCLCKVCHSL